MNLVWFLIIIGILWIFFYLIARHYNLSKHGIMVAPLILIIKTVKLNRVVERIAKKYEKPLNFLFKAGIYLYYLLLVISIIALSINLIPYLLLKKDTGVGLIPLIPGITLSLKRFVYFIFPISIALFVHELSHGIAAINEKIKVRSIGIIFFFIVLLAAFAELDPDELEKADKVSKKKVYVAGITANILLASLFVPLIGMNNFMTSQLYEPGNGVLVVGVRNDSPASKAGITEGTIITGILITSNNTYIQTPTVEKLVLTMNSLEEGEKIVVTTLENRNYTLVTPPSSSLKTSLEGGRFGLLLFQYFEPKYPFLSPKLPYIIQEEIFLTINLNIVLALLNSLPIIGFDGNKFLYLSAENSPRKKIAVDVLQLLSINLIIFNLIVSF